MAGDPPVPEPSAPSEVTSDETLLRFDYPGSDIVLHSCDSFNFHVPKLYIVNSSPVFRELIIRSVSDTSGGPSGEEQEPFPVVNFPESGATLYSLLTFIFPVDSVFPSTSEKIMELLAVAQKYQMHSVLNHIRGVISRMDPPFICPDTALHIYFLAREHELHHEAIQAARVTLRFSITIEDLGDKLDFPGLTGAYLHDLWRYHKQVRDDLKSGVLEFRSSGLPDGVKQLRCQIHENVVFNASPPLWLDRYIESIADSPPSRLFDPIGFDDEWARHIKLTVVNFSRTCSCVDISSQLRRAFWDALTAVVHKTIEKVRRAGMTKHHFDHYSYKRPQADSALALVKEEPILEISDPSFVPTCLNIPDANIILRSSDQVNFYVHRSLLSMSSPFFKDLLSLPQPPSDGLVDGLPVIEVPEDAGLLNNLVSLLYPIRRVKPSSYEKVFALLSACQKYDMISIQSYIRDEVKLGRFPAPVRAQAFGAYAIASSMDLVPEMEHAARLTIGQPLTFKSLGECLRSFKGPALFELIRYREGNRARRGRGNQT